MESIFERLKEIMVLYKNHYYKILRRPENSDILDFINNWYDFPLNTKLRTKIFWVLNNIHDIPLCKTCGNPVPINNISYKTNSYCQYCSNKCSTSGTDRNEKRKKTNTLRYGGNAPICSSIVKEKTKNTNIERYGTEYTFKSDKIKDKIRSTNMDRYGVEFPIQSDDVALKIKNTCLNKYGVENGGGSPESIEKNKKRCLDKYGVEYYFQSDDAKQKIKKTCLDKYGVDSYLKTGIPQQSSIIRIKNESYDSCILNNEYDEPCFSREFYIEHHDCGNDPYFEFEFKCKKCGKTFKSYHRNGVHSRCPTCFPKKLTFEENEVFDFISGVYHEKIIHGDGSFKIIPPYQLDFYMPDRNLAIEFDGLYWHSESNNKSKTYHLTKTELCEKSGIQLVHIFENEWIYNQKIVKSRLMNMLGIYDRTVYARKCSVGMVQQDVSALFQEQNHLQGAVNSPVNIGLFHDGELVSLMTFGKCRFDKKHEWELVRFCSRLGYHVPGAVGKLLKYFEKNWKPKSLVTYADRRWSTGKLYKALGFSFMHNSPPNYWYFKSNEIGKKLHSRIEFQKHKLKGKLEKFDPAKSEVENMKDNGYHRIFDCGNMVFEKNYESQEST